MQRRRFKNSRSLELWQEDVRNLLLIIATAVTQANTFEGKWLEDFKQRRTEPWEAIE